MLKSMTGFGRSEGNTALGKVYVETRSINHRYSDINLKLPKRLTPFELRIKEMIKSDVSRGRIDVSLKLDSSGEGKVELDVDFDVAEQYYRALHAMKEKFNLSGEITLQVMAGAKELITAKEEQEDVEPYWQEIAPIVKQSLSAMDAMKRSEGEVLTKDIQKRLEHIRQEIAAIKQRFPLNLETARDRLREKVQSLLGGLDVDPARFQQEIAFLAERTDITEEIVRAESHLGQFAVLLKEQEPVGRKLDFLLQEIHREVNTISSKANDSESSQRVVEIKSELERIREQVQNIE
ncbi:MAG: YicC family protein [Deltaproteobacteria bacterium RBG_13_52_11b]|nr:MAG: YicC family protein [Deltaproteobacteria bacterium RBG_13_52_11b]